MACVLYARIMESFRSCTLPFDDKIPRNKLKRKQCSLLEFTRTTRQTIRFQRMAFLIFFVTKKGMQLAHWNSAHNRCRMHRRMPMLHERSSPGCLKMQQGDATAQAILTTFTRATTGRDQRSLLAPSLAAISIRPSDVASSRMIIPKS